MNDDIISINNYSSSSDEFKSLPYSGWIKPCFYKDCRTISSHFTIITYKKTQFKVYLCKKCHDQCRYYFNNELHDYIDFVYFTC